jgi:hypothetical protein
VSGPEGPQVIESLGAQAAGAAHKVGVPVLVALPGLKDAVVLFEENAAGGGVAATGPDDVDFDVA